VGIIVAMIQRQVVKGSVTRVESSCFRANK
jgi:hypothetical protein